MLENSNLPVVFYGNTLRAFRTTLIWYLYEVCQKYECYLVISELDQPTRDFLSIKQNFPGLKKIIVQDCTNRYDKNIFKLNSSIYKLAVHLIYDLNPQIVFCSSDWHSLFEMYLLRLARKKGILRITLQDTITNDINTTRVFYKLNEKNNLRQKNLNRVEVAVLSIIRKPLLHILVYWFCPLLNLEKPFFGKSSYILMTGNSGIRDSCMHVVFKNNYDMFVKSGVLAEKLLINEHPITRMKRDLVNQLFNNEKVVNSKSVVILVSDLTVGYSLNGLSPISYDIKFKERCEIIKCIANSLPDFQIILKGHPNIKDMDVYKNSMLDIKNDLFVAPKNESAEKYIISSDIIVDLPAPNSSSIFFATLIFPPKVIVCIDTLQEFMGDYFKDYEKITYLTTIDQVLSFFRNLSESKMIPNSSLTANENNNRSKNISEIIEYVRDHLVKS